MKNTGKNRAAFDVKVSQPGKKKNDYLLGKRPIGEPTEEELKELDIDVDFLDTWDQIPTAKFVDTEEFLENFGEGDLHHREDGAITDSTGQVLFRSGDL